MDNLERLVAIDAIRQLKARYFRLCDLMDLEGYLSVFTQDAVLVYDLDKPASGSPRQLKLNGRAELAEFCRACWGTEMLWSAHHGMTAEIEILSADEARAVWAMQDVVEMRETDYHGFGHYHETYRRTDGKWQIRSLHLTRTRVIETPRTAAPRTA